MPCHHFCFSVHVGVVAGNYVAILHAIGCLYRYDYVHAVSPLLPAASFCEAHGEVVIDVDAILSHPGQRLQYTEDYLHYYLFVKIML